MNHVKKLIDRIGDNKAVEDPDGRWDLRPMEIRPAKLPGVYTLLRGGRVVFVGKAADPEGEIETRRVGLSFLPPIQFDEVRIVRVHPDRIDEAYEAAKAAPSRGDPPP